MALQNSFLNNMRQVTKFSTHKRRNYFIFYKKKNIQIRAAAVCPNLNLNLLLNLKFECKQLIILDKLFFYYLLLVPRNSVAFNLVLFSLYCKNACILYDGKN